MSLKNFKEKGYCIVRSAISDELRDFVTQCALFDEMQNFSAEADAVHGAQVPDAHSVYANPVMESMLLHLQAKIKENTGLGLYPTYSYYRVYRNGDSLDKHVDRPSCQISATVCFNYNYNDQQFSWPIYMDNREIILMPGDMVIYRGMELEHWRDPLDHHDDVWHVQGFFHYVDTCGPYAGYKFDQRESIGTKTAKTQTESIQKNILNKPYISFIR